MVLVVLLVIVVLVVSGVFAVSGLFWGVAGSEVCCGIAGFGQVNGVPTIYSNSGTHSGDLIKSRVISESWSGCAFKGLLQNPVNPKISDACIPLSGLQ